MADITDDFGRTKELDNAGFEKLASMLKSAVKTTNDFISKSKENLDSSQTLNKMEKALNQLGENIKKETSSAQKIVNDVKKAIEKLEKVKSTKKEKSSFEDFKKIQTEQSKILSMILKNQQKAKSEKLALYTSGSSSLPKTKTLSDIGFKARGPDRYPAMLSKNEFVINEKAAKKHGPLLDRINQGKSFRGYRVGGKVKYLSEGTPGPANVPSHIRGSANYSINIDTGNANEAIETAEDIGKKMAQGVQKGFSKNYKMKWARFLTGSGAFALGGQADFLQTLFGGGVRDATEFQREMRNIAFQTKGITGDFRDLQKEFSKLGDSIAKRTGKNLDAVQESYLRNLQKGFKSNKAGLKVIESGLNLSTLIGSETHQTADLFADWHRRLKLSSNEMNKMSRDMRSVAKSTGVTGDELLSVMKSSEGILKNLKNQKNLTTNSVKNIVTMMAESQKYGFEESTSKVLDALSGTNKMLGADNQTKALLYTVGNMMGGDAVNSMRSGNFTKDRDNLAGFSDQLLKLTSNLSDGAIKGIEDFDKLSAEEKQLLTIRLRGYGLEIAEAEHLIKMSKKASRGLDGTLEDLDKTINSKYGTSSEKKLAKQQKTEFLKNAGLDLLSAFREKSSGDEGLSKVMSDVFNNSDYKNNIQDLAVASKSLGYGDIASMSPEKQAQTAALVASKQLSALAKENGMQIKDYSSEFEKAIAKGDNKKFNEIYDEFSKKSDELGIKMATNVSPQEKLAQTLTELNETIRKYTSSFVGKALDFVGGIGLLLVQLGILSAQLGFLSSGQGVLDYIFKRKGGAGKANLDLDGWIEGLRKNQGGMVKGKKSRNLFEVFGKGFKRSQDAGDGFFKSLTKGFKRSDKILTTIGNSWKKNIISSLDVFGKNTEIVFKKMSSRFYKFARKTLPRVIDGLSLIGDYIGGRFIKYLRIGKARLFDLGRSFLKINWLDIIALPGRKIIESLNFIGNKGSIIFDSFKKGMSIRHIAIMAYIKAYKGLRSLPSMIKTIFSAKGIAKGIGGIGKGLRLGISGMAKGARAALIGGSAGMLQIVFSVVDGIFGAFHGFSNTGKNFEDTLNAMGKSANEASWGMYAASTVAGTLTGILDGLTFGLLGFLGITKFLEKALSLLSYTFFSVIEGIIEGFKWALGGIGPIFKSISATLSEVGQSFLNIFNSIAGIFGAEASNFGEAFALIYPWFKLIGKIIGVIVGSPIIALLYALSGVLWVVAKAIQGTVFLIEKLVTGIVAPFKWLYNILVGNSIIPDLCIAIVGFFGKMAFNVMSIVGKMIWGVAKFFLKLPFKLLKGMFNFFVKFPLKMISDTLKMAGKIFTMGLPGAIRGLSKFFASFKGYFFEFSKVAFNTWYKLLGYLGGSWLSKAKDVFFNLLNWLAKGGKNAWDAIKNTGKWIKDTVVKTGSKVAGVGGKVIEGAKWAGSKVAGLLPKKAPVAGGGGFWSVPPETLKKTATNVSNVTKSAPSKLLGFFSKGGKLIGSLAKKLPAIGPLLDFGIRKAGGQSTGKAAFGAGGALAGGLAGAAIGTAILPGIGTAIGGIIGAIASGELADAIYDNVGSAFGYLGEKLYDGASWVGEKLYDGASWISNGTKWMGEKLYDGASWVGEKLYDSSDWVKEKAKQAATGLWEGAKNVAKTATLPQRMAVKAASWIGNKTKETAGWIGGKLADSAKWLGSWFGIGKSEKLAEDTSNKLKNTTDVVSTPVGQHAIPTLKPEEGVAGVQPAHLSSISESILRDKAGAQGSSAKVQSDELSRIEEVSNKQVDELQLIREGIMTMVEILKPKGTIGEQSQEAGSTKDPRRPMHAAVFGKMKYGKVGGNANRSLINNGEV